MDYSALISKRRERFSELAEAVGDPTLFADPKRATEILRDRALLRRERNCQPGGFSYIGAKFLALGIEGVEHDLQAGGMVTAKRASACSLPRAPPRRCSRPNAPSS